MKNASPAFADSAANSAFNEKAENIGAFAVPLTAPSAKTETDRRMLLVRLSDAAEKIRKETELIQRTSFNDPAGRLLRILGETIEEQRLSFGAAVGDKK